MPGRPVPGGPGGFPGSGFPGGPGGGFPGSGFPGGPVDGSGPGGNGNGSGGNGSGTSPGGNGNNTGGNGNGSGPGGNGSGGSGNNNGGSNGNNPGAGNNNSSTGNSGSGTGSSSNSGSGICGLTEDQVSALTPLLKKLGLAQTGDEIKELVRNIVFGVGDILESDTITQLLDTVDKLVNSLGLGGLDTKPAVDEVVSVLRNQVPCLLNTLLPLP
ncbi:hypothetical protein LPJ79_002014 [Coemansia sp. RSA 1821]|nr:hypothetical protein LPJ68_004691 [Coemansia sp. RSA 1086]KAJ1751535.1 hypothetical protein LPJ79_002014 [Coemansia sp. RSA 1821]